MERRKLLALSSGVVAAAIAGCVGGTDTDSDDPSGSTSRSNGTGSSGGSEDTSGGSQGGSDDETVESGEEQTGVEIDDEQLETLVAATNEFAFDLYGQLLDGGAEENLFASPISISLALVMTYAGAREQTRAQMRDALRYELDDDVIHAGFGELQQAFEERNETDSDTESSEDSESSEDTESSEDSEEESQPFELSVVNSVWGQEGYPFEEDYLETLESHYGGGLREVDYTTDADRAREEINDWVAEETNDRIEDLLPAGAMDQLTRLILVNAVYFLANWKHTFPEEETSEQTFTAIDGSEHDVQMMHQENRFPYAEVDGTQAVELPYVGDDVSMLLILPPEGAFEEYETDVSPETLAGVVDELESQEGEVSLPRFEFESGLKLGESLRALGMTDAFDPEAANFDGIADTDEDLFLHEAFHDTFVAVDEEGTEAAAATAVVVGTTDAGPSDPFEFVADRPFLFAIRDRPTGSLLFLGRTVDPSGWE